MIEFENMIEKKTNLDSMFKSFETELTNWQTPSVQRQAITIWVPDEYKAKYDMLQERSKRKFGKLIKELLKRAIDKFDTNQV